MFFTKSKSKNKIKVLSCLLAFSVFFTQFSFIMPTEVQAASDQADSEQADSGTLVVYPAPTGATLSTAYTVEVQEPGGDWQSLDVYSARNVYGTGAFVYFDTDSAVNIRVTYLSADVVSAEIKPISAGITPQVEGNVITYSISGPQKVQLQINEFSGDALDIFANPLEVDPPSPDDPDVIYLAPGIYSGNYTVPSGKTLYIAGGAVVKGTVFLDNATNAKVIGRGIIDRPTWKGVSADYANQITIDGIIVVDYGAGNNGGCAIELGNATNVTINNFKAYSYLKWTDGIDLLSSSNVTINDVYLRCGDDSIAVYASRANGGRLWSGDSKNVSVTNSFLYCDVAHPINIGTHGDPTAPGGGDTISGLSFENIDIVDDSNSSKVNMSVTSSDGSLVTDVSFTNIRIDDRQGGKLADVITFKNSAYGLAVGRGVNNVYFKDITYVSTGTATTAGIGQVYGTSGNMTQNVTFENVEVNGEVITSASGNVSNAFTVGSNTSNIQFIASGDAAPATTPLQAPVPINLALNKTASADSYATDNPAFNANDGSAASEWSAADGDAGHWWMVDLGSNLNITDGTQVTWATNDVYKYKIEISNDKVNWTLKVDNTTNNTKAQVQNDLFLATARYVRITITGLPEGSTAGISDIQVLGVSKNLALNKTAASDSAAAGTPASNGSDGNAATLWSANDTDMEHYLQVDLGSSMNITYGTQVVWPTSDVYQYKIETSNDNENWTLAVDKTDNKITDQVQNDYFTATARYVRITVAGMPAGTSASLYDLKVYGDFTNFAEGKTTTADSSEPANTASKAIDGVPGTMWRANDGDSGHWWMVDLGKTVKITNGTQILWEKSGLVYKYTIETSLDNETWTTVVDKTGEGVYGNCNSAQVQADYFTGTARYVRVTVYETTNENRAGFYDFQVLGEADPEAAPVISAVGGLATFMGTDSTMKMITTPAKDVTWSVTDVEDKPTALATIDETTGVLRAVSEGTIKVVATYSGGEVSKEIKIDNSELKTVDDTDDAIIYTQGSSASNWVVSDEYTSIDPGVEGLYAADVKAEFTFTGTGIQWIGKLGSGEAKVDVYIDDIKMKTVDPYNDSLVSQHINYSLEGLNYGVHTIKLVNTGTKNEAATGYNLSVDAFRYLDSAVETVTLYSDKTTIDYGTTATLSVAATLTSGDIYDLSSSAIDYTNTDPDVASVSEDGVVTAKNAGTTDITATVTKDGIEKSSNVITITVIPEMTLAPEADADVHSWRYEKQRNYGIQTVMRIQYNAKLAAADFNSWFYHPDDAEYDGQTDTTDLKVSYLRFDLSGLDPSKVIKKVELKVSSTTDLSTKLINVLAVDDVTWIEGTRTGIDTDSDAVPNDGTQGINFYNRPTLGAALTTGYGGSANAFSALDITEYVKASVGNKISVALTSDSSNGTTAYSLNTMENTDAASRPYLLITYYADDASVDKTELQELYNVNKDKEKGDYTDESWTVFTEALAAASAVLEDPEATQPVVDAQVTALDAAVKGLAEKEVDTKIMPEADADVHSWQNEKQRNYGTQTVMKIQYNAKLDADDFNAWYYQPDDATYNGQSDGTDLKVSYLRFDLSDIDTTRVIKKAELKVSSTVDLSTKLINVLAVDDVTWIEGTKTGVSSTADAVPTDGTEGINFYSRPALGATLTTGYGGSANEFSALDITEYVKESAGDKISVALTSDSSNGTTAYSLNTKENSAASRPYLYITYYTAEELAEELVSAVAGSITGITAPEEGAASLTLPTVPEGYSIAIKSVTPEGIISTDGTITPPAVTTTVTVVFTVTDTATGATADTAGIDVDIAASQVIDTVLESLQLEPPVKTTYTVGEELDLSGMSVKAIYSNGDSKDLEAGDYVVTGYDQETVGTQIITVSYTEGNITKTAEFTIAVAEAPPVVKENSITVKADGNGTVSINGSDPADTSTYNYQVGETVTIAAHGDTFRYWTNANNKVISTKASFTITAATNEVYTAMFAETRTISFMSNEQLIKTVIVPEDAEEVTFPDDPFSYGHTFAGWDMDEEAILTALATGDVTVYAVYKKTLIDYYVDVTKGKTTGDYEALTLVTVTADAPAAGQQFSHWMDGDGNIMNYKSTYNFYVTKDIDLEAVFVDAAAEIEKEVLIQITNVVANSDANKLSFTAERALPAGVTLVQHGIILTADPSLDEDTFIIGASGILKGTATTTGMNGTYVLNKGNVFSGDTWSARGYVIYKDADGVVKTVYSDIVSETMN